MPRLFYLSKQQLFQLELKTSLTVPCQAIEQYKKNLREIKQRKKWKSNGAGAHFMGVADEHSEGDIVDSYVTDMLLLDDQQLLYSANLDGGTAIQVKPLSDWNIPEALVLRKNDFIAYDLALDAMNRRLVMSCSVDYELEHHLCVLSIDGNRIQFVTEGECQDANPFVDPRQSDHIYYDSCGLSYTSNVFFGPREICKLDLATGELETIFSDPKFDYLKAQVDLAGNLYFIERPYQVESVNNSFGGFLKNIVLAPFKILKAIVAWLDFFTQRYTGESLKRTSGRNPAKVQQKTEEELFVEGNLIEVQKNTEKNKGLGEKFPGSIPNSWKLIQVTPTGERHILKSGVMSYVLHESSIIYSNGRHLIELDHEGNEEVLVEAKLISKIRVF